MSGRSAAGLAAQAARLAAYVGGRPGLDLADVGFSLATTRSAFEYRAVVTGTDRAELTAGLAALAEGRAGAGVVSGRAPGVPRVGFVFAGQGSQRAGMGAELHAASPVFAAAFDRACALLEGELGVPVADVVLGRAADGDVADQTLYAQAGLFAVQAGLVALLGACGVTPDAVAGHSVGEAAAAYAAGVLSLEDACRLVAARARLMQALPEGGAMTAIAVSEAEVAAALAGVAGVSVAAVNGPASVVISGDAEAVAQVAEGFAGRGVRVRPLRVSHAFHSHRMEAVLEPLTAVVAGLEFSAPRVPWAGALTGELVTVPEAGYWVRQVREPVRFADAVATLAAQGVSLFIEIGPDGTLSALGPGALPERQDGTAQAVFTPVLRPGQPAPATVTAALARAHVQGTQVNWPAVLGGGRRVELPTYAFQRQRFWAEPVDVRAVLMRALGGDGAGAASEALFWAAVEDGDVAGLAEALAVEDQRELAQVLPALAAWRRRERDRSVTQGWRYRVAWAPIPDPDPAVLTGSWLVVVPEGLAHAEPVAGCVRALGAAGAHVVMTESSAGDDRTMLAARISQALNGDELSGVSGVSGVSGIVSLLGLDEGPVLDSPVVSGGLAGTLTLVQALGDAGVDAPLWLLTCGAVAAGPGEVLASPVQAQVWGLGRVAGLEHPDRWGGLVDVPPVLDERAGMRLCAVLAGCGEDQVAIRGAAILARRLARAPLARGPQPRAAESGAPQPRDGADQWQTSGTVLITGGTGAIGGHVARWAPPCGAGRVVLTSRSGPAAPGMAALAAELAETTQVSILACDTAERPALTALLTWIGTSGPPLSAVMHTAGVLDDGVLEGLSIARLGLVLAAKATGAAYLDELTAGMNLDAFVLFSSAAAVFGGAGQGNYAAANAFLDALAEARRGRGLPATSIAWGPWAGGGLADANEAVRQRLRRGAMQEMDPDPAIKALGQALTGGDGVLAVMNVDWTRWGGAGRVPFLRNLPEVRELAGDGGHGAPTDDSEQHQGELARGLAVLPPAEQVRVLTDLVRTQASAVLGHASPEAVEPGRAFRDLGFDSLTALEMRQAMSAVTGLRLPATLLFDYPSPVVLAEFLRAELAGTSAGAAAVPVASVVVTGEPVAIVGMSCRFPGGVNSPQELWELLATGTDAISEFPADRGWDTGADRGWDTGADQAETPYVRLGGFVYNAADFDPAFFGISPREALAMDPQQRLLLEVCWEALERTGIDPGSLRGSSTGVFAGTSGQDYVGLASGSEQGLEGHLGTGNAASVISGRVSYALGLEGPAVTVDTACSSALVALHLAGQALRAGECDLALAGGVTIMATPGSFAEFSRQRGLASDGRCKAFSAAADGTGWGEGAGMLVVERLSDARRNGHRVLAVVAGSAINQDGASNGLTAPNGPSQQRVIRAALAHAGLAPSDVDAVEAHGTGTVLGDPIEAQALLATYGQGRDADRALWLGSVKSNIGHTQAAAGVAGVMKMVLALERDMLPATLHAQEPSPHVDWSSGAVRLLTEPVPWPGDGNRTRRAGISSFGISGTNAHVILAEDIAAETGAADSKGAGQASGPEAGSAVTGRPMTAVPIVTGGPMTWLISGRSAAGLAAQAARLAAYVGGRPGLDLADVGFSLATTRSAFEYRAVVTGTDRAELTAGLAALAEGRAGAGVVSGRAPGVPRVGFVFAGQGSQRAGMGAELHAASPVFAAAFDRACALLEGELGVPVADVVLGRAADGDVADQTLYAQAGLFAVQAGLVALLGACGVTPDAVAGHSVGEAAAAYAAGVLSLEDACRLVAARARLMQALPEGGAMTAIAVSEAEVAAALAGVAGVSVAAVNGPASVVISGDAEAVAQVAEGFAGRGVRVRPLRVSHAFHSHRMEAVLEPLTAVVAGLEFSAPRVPWAGALTGELVTVPEAGYWVRQVREPVRFADAVATLAAQGVSLFIEIGPDGTLSALGPGALPERQDGTAQAVFTPVLRPGQPAPATVTAALARAHVQGTQVNWPAVLGGGRRVELPTYAFQRQRFWAEPVDVRAVLMRALGGDGAGAASEALFWAAVEDGDVAGLAEALAVEDQRELAQVLPALAAWRRRERDRSVTQGWRYRVAWAPIPDPDPAVLTGSWLVVVPAGQVHADLTVQTQQALAAAGAQVLITESAAGDDRAALAARITQAQAEAEANEANEVSGVLSLLALTAAPAAGYPGVSGGLAATMTLVQALGDADLNAPLWLLTRGAVTATATDVLANPVQAQVWGLGRVAGLEHPDRWGGLVDVPPTLDDRAGARLCAILAGCGEDQVAIRGAAILARRLTRAPQPRAPQPRASQPQATGANHWHTDGTALITGGTGAIGGHLARWVTSRGSRRLVLTSRSGPAAPNAAALAAKLAESTQVSIIACDTAERPALTALLTWIGTSGPPLSAVMHTAGTGQATTLDNTTVAELAAVATAKVAGAAHLDELTAGLDLDAFVLFSSIAATWGSGLQPAYAAANAYLDAVAQHRLGRALPATSVAWGPWGGGGMSEGEGGTQLQRRGLRLMDPELAVRTLEQVLDHAEGLVTIADVDWARFAPAFTVRRPSPLIAGLPEVTAALTAAEAPSHQPSQPGTQAALREQLAALPPAEREQRVVELVRAEAAIVLGHARADAVEAERAFRDLGFDSLTAIELRDRLNAATGLRLPATVIFDYPTPAALGGFVWAGEFEDKSAPVPLLGELDKLDSLLSGAAPDDATHQLVAARLQEFLAKWSNIGVQSPSQAVAEKIGAASDDEIFEFINKELGRS